MVLYPAQPQTMMHLLKFLTTGGSRAATIAFTHVNEAMKRKSVEATTCLIKNIPETLLSGGGALDILDCTEFMCETLSLFRRGRLLLLPVKLLHHLEVIA